MTCVNQVTVAALLSRTTFNSHRPRSPLNPSLTLDVASFQAPLLRGRSFKPTSDLRDGMSESNRSPTSIYVGAIIAVVALSSVGIILRIMAVRRMRMSCYTVSSSVFLG